MIGYDDSLPCSFKLQVVCSMLDETVYREVARDVIPLRGISYRVAPLRQCLDSKNQD